MLPVLLSLEHFNEQEEGDCLVVCVEMVLNYLGRPTSYKRLRRILRTKRHLGTPFYHVKYLEKLDVTVFHQRGTMEQLYKTLQNGYPCIVSVHTKELPYSEDATQHAIVVVGMDEDTVWVNDPAEQDAPLPVPIGDFDLAWLVMREQFSVITAG